MNDGFIVKKTIGLAVARNVAAAAEAESVRLGLKMCIAVVDDGGVLVHLIRLDGTQIGSVDVAVAKARTAVAFKRATKVFEDAVAAGRNALLTLPDVLAVEGGLPLIHDGEIVGAVGVSGASSAEDGLVAAAGAAALVPAA